MVYGGLGASFYFNFIKSKQLKKDYLAATGVERDNFYTKWENSYDMSKYLLYGAAGAWAVNLIWTAIIPVKENYSKRMNMSFTTFRENELLISMKWTF